jgi:branched-chain amino acid transport system substrate-binding protein
MMKSIYRAFSFLISASMWCAYGGNSPALAESSATPTAVGVSLVLSGLWASWGEPIRNGLQLGAKQTKNNIQLSFQDDRCEARNSLSIFQKYLAIDKLPIIILGCMESIEATMPYAESKGATVLTMGGMSKEYLARFPHLVGLYALVDAEAYYLVPYLRDRAQVKRLGIINHSATYGEYFGRGLEKLAGQAGITVVRRESVDHAETDFRAIITRTLHDKPDAIVAHISAEKEGLLIKQLRELGFAGQLFATFSFEAPDTKVAGGHALEGVRYTYPVQVAEKSEAYQKFKAAYVEAYKIEPQSTAAIAFDAVQLLDDSISACGPKNSDCIAKFFAQRGEFSRVRSREPGRDKDF